MPCAQRRPEASNMQIRINGTVLFSHLRNADAASGALAPLQIFATLGGCMPTHACASPVNAMRVVFVPVSGRNNPLFFRGKLLRATPLNFHGSSSRFKLFLFRFSKGAREIRTRDTLEWIILPRQLPVTHPTLPSNLRPANYLFFVMHL